MSASDLSLSLYTLSFGGILAAVLSALVLVSLWHEPRIWLHHFPKSLRQRMPPKTPREIVLTRRYGAAIVPLFVGVPIIAALDLHAIDPSISYAEIGLVAFAIPMIFGLVDLLIIDWLIVCAWVPRFTMASGFDNPDDYRDYMHHLRGFLAGIPLACIIALLAIGAVALVDTLTTRS